MDLDHRPLRQKGKGKSILVSVFLCECHGRLQLSPEQQPLHLELPPAAVTIIKPGKNADGFWDNSDLINQTKNRMMTLFKFLYPGCDALVIYDNSGNHHAFTSDPLVASRLNLSDGGKNVKTTTPGWCI
uniref:DDE-1 domain-containing protein n=1 Tax=Spongospora subterranea TaxID=70186 RepID=A0A0H5QX45_9EUKA|eukprot:CRZ06516.1 hypothetical protein [Spongospora subterranea]